MRTFGNACDRWQSKVADALASAVQLVRYEAIDPLASLKLVPFLDSEPEPEPDHHAEAMIDEANYAMSKVRIGLDGLIFGF